MRQTPRLKIIRRALGLTQEQFAARFHIPLGTLRDWEQGASQPDQTARAYLRAIAGDAGAVQRALEAVPFVSFMECLSVDGLDLNRDRDTGRDVAL